MRRKTFDLLAVIGGLVLAVVLAVAGGLLLWGHNFVSDQVHTQLAAQKIVLPARGQPGDQGTARRRRHGHDGRAAQRWMTTVGGGRAPSPPTTSSPCTLRKIGGGKTYSQLATASLAQPKNTALAAQVQTVFRGETLRGLLLNAYGFWQMGQIMLIGAIVAFVAAAVMLILAVLGFMHLRRVPAEAEVFSGRAATAAKPAPAL